MASVHVSYDGLNVVAKEHYAILKPAPVLAIDFGAVEAFKVYEESSSRST